MKEDDVDAISNQNEANEDGNYFRVEDQENSTGKEMEGRDSNSSDEITAIAADVLGEQKSEQIVSDHQLAIEMADINSSTVDYLIINDTKCQRIINERLSPTGLDHEIRKIRRARRKDRRTSG